MMSRETLSDQRERVSERMIAANPVCAAPANLVGVTDPRRYEVNEDRAV